MKKTWNPTTSIKTKGRIIDGIETLRKDEMTIIIVIPKLGSTTAAIM